MSDAEFAALKADIGQYGQREPVWLYEGKVIDGRDRARACEELGKAVRTEVYDGFDPVAFVISLNLHRRHLSESQRAMVAAKIATLPKGANQHAQICAPSQDAAAGMLNVSRRTVQAATKVKDEGAPELVAAVESGLVSVSAAATIAEASQDRQREIVARGEHEVLQAAKAIREEKAVTRRAELAQIRAQAAPPPAGKYECIVIDPPLEMQKIERDVHPNQVAFDYRR